jgi:Rieske Fe-S protein
MYRRALLLLTMALTALALTVTPALAGEDPNPGAPPAAQPTPTQPSPTPTQPTPVPVVHGSAKLRTSQGCMAANRTKASVSGKAIESVAFFVDGKKVRTVTTPDSSGRYTFSMSCTHLSVGTHRARAAVAFRSGASPTSRTMIFQITRASQVSPQFAG